MSLRDLDALFGVPDLAAATSDVTPDVAMYRQWVRARLADPAVYKTLLPVLASAVTSLGIQTQVVGLVPLRVGQTKTKRAFYFRYKPCAERELERVHPWWKPSETILVCHEDYLPNVVVAPSGLACDQTAFSIPEGSGCGCGPNLMFCGTAALNDALKAAMNEELALTIQAIVESDRPFSDLLAMNETVRSGLADLFYARVAFFLTGKFVPPEVDRTASLRPRGEIYQGGILSTPVYLFGDGHRTLVAETWANFLCMPVRGMGVETKVLLDTIHKTKTASNLRQATHLDLAHTLGCQNCHARLEYGQFPYSGWQQKATGMHFIPPTVPEANARFYGRDHEDLRAEGPPTLAWLGQTLASQPEFAKCMVSRVTQFVYEGTRVPFEVEAELLRRFQDGQHMHALIEDAIVARAFGSAALHGRDAVSHAGRPSNGGI